MTGPKLFGNDAASGSASLLFEGHRVDPNMALEVARFRRAERSRLVAARALPPEARERAIATLISGLSDVVTVTSGIKIAAYWPSQGEPDLRAWMAMTHYAGAHILLPVVEERAAPLLFRTWAPGCRMVRGFRNVLVPADGRNDIPDIVVAPLIGVDRALFRLGNGGGYYDRTLARLNPRPRAIGVGFAGCILPTIHPMPWDVPMDAVVLSDGTKMVR